MLFEVKIGGASAPGIVYEDLSQWNNAGGVLTFKLKSMNSTQHLLTFTVRNPLLARASPDISIAATGISGIREIAIVADEMAKGDAAARGVPSGENPLLVVVEDSPKTGFWTPGSSVPQVAVCGDGFQHYSEGLTP